MIEFLILCVIVAVGLYLLKLVPMDGRIYTIIQVIAIAVLVIMAIRLLLPMAGLS